MACSLSRAAAVYPHARGCSRRIGGRLPAPARKACSNVDVRPPPHPAGEPAPRRASPSPMRYYAASSPKKPLTTQDIAQSVMAERGLDTANVRLLKTMTKRTGACLRNLQQQAVSRQPGQFTQWEVVRATHSPAEGLISSEP